MKYLFWAASIILLIDVFVSQEVEYPCKNVTDCQNVPYPHPQVVCDGGHCRCPDAEGKPESCSKLSVNQSLMQPQRSVASAEITDRPCTIDQDCGTATYAFCNTTRRQCSCNPKYSISSDGLRCLPPISYQQPGCETAQQCLSAVGNSTCVNGTCQCEENYQYNSNSCWVKIGFGQPCNVTEECGHVSNAVCDAQKRCNCPSDRVIDSNVLSCLPIASKIQSDCEESIQCTQLLGDRSTCSSKKCVCHPKHHPSPKTNKCMPNLDFGADCHEDVDCSQGENQNDTAAMRCHDHKCHCTDGYDNLGGKCLRGARLDNVGVGNSAVRQLTNASTFSMILALSAIFSMKL